MTWLKNNISLPTNKTPTPTNTSYMIPDKADAIGIVELIHEIWTQQQIIKLVEKQQHKTKHNSDVLWRKTIQNKNK